jgi:hypothetical protein
MLAALPVFVRAFTLSRSRLQIENAVLRHQLAVYQRSIKRPKLRDRDRLLWSLLSRATDRWRDWLFIATPRTVIRWQRRRFRDYWRRLSQ